MLRPLPIMQKSQRTCQSMRSKSLRQTKSRKSGHLLVQTLRIAMAFSATLSSHACEQEHFPHHSLFLTPPLGFRIRPLPHTQSPSCTRLLAYAPRGANPNLLASILTLPKATAQHLLHIIRRANLIFTTFGASVCRTRTLTPTCWSSLSLPYLCSIHAASTPTRNPLP